MVRFTAVASVLATAVCLVEFLIMFPIVEYAALPDNSYLSSAKYAVVPPRAAWMFDMRLIFIYGAPGVGKLTVAKELAGLTGYRLHHNHMAIDLALALFDFDNPNFLRLCQRINLDVFEVANQAKLPCLIFTFTYGGSLDDQFINEVISRYESDALFVHLFCELDELKRRVITEERQTYKKVTDVTVLMRALDVIDYAKPIAHSHHLAIDTTTLQPEDAARKIVEHYDL